MFIISTHKVRSTVGDHIKKKNKLREYVKLEKRRMERPQIYKELFVRQW